MSPESSFFGHIDIPCTLIVLTDTITFVRMDATLLSPVLETAILHNGIPFLSPDYTRGRKVVVLTDTTVAGLYPGIAQAYPAIIIPGGEQQKSLASIDAIATQLIALAAGRDTLLTGIGGGMITDITGFTAAVYMRGISFGFVPTTLLGMTDAAIGGKNGVNLGLHKNMIGVFRQPSFILQDISFLQTLPDTEWANGFAEIIKYACIFDAALLDELASRNLSFYKTNTAALQLLIRRCVNWKQKTVIADEQEHGIRKLLNFGHTAGHALETLYQLSHGAAVAAGMVLACRFSEQLTGLPAAVTKQISTLLQQYALPTSIPFSAADLTALMLTDKKQKDGGVDYVLLEQAGKGIIQHIDAATISRLLAAIVAKENR